MVPSSSPSLTPPTVEKFVYQFNRTAENRESLEAVLKKEDIQNFITLNETASLVDGGELSLRYLRQQENAVEYMKLLNFTSAIVGVCESLDDLFECFMVESRTFVEYYSGGVSRAVVDLIVADDMIEIYENQENIILSRPKETISTITFQFENVINKKMTNGELDIFEDDVLDFLNKELSLLDPPLHVKSVKFNKQVIDVVASESSVGLPSMTPSSYPTATVPPSIAPSNHTLYESPSIELNSQSSNNDDINSTAVGQNSGVVNMGSRTPWRTIPASRVDEEELYYINITVTVETRYLPPPEIDSTKMVIKVFQDEETKTEFLEEAIENKYFDKAPDKDKVGLSYIGGAENSEVEYEVSENSTSKSNIFGPLGIDGGIAVIVVGSVAVSLALLIVVRKARKLKHKEVIYAKRKEEYMNHLVKHNNSSNAKFKDYHSDPRQGYSMYEDEHPNPGSFQVSESDSDQAWMKKERSDRVGRLELRRPGSHQVSGSDLDQPWMQKECSHLAGGPELRKPGSDQVSGSDLDQPWMKKERSHLAGGSELRRPGSYQVSGSDRGQSWTKNSKISTGRLAPLQEGSNQESADLVFKDKGALISIADGKISIADGKPPSSASDEGSMAKSISSRGKRRSLIKELSFISRKSETSSGGSRRGLITKLSSRQLSLSGSNEDPQDSSTLTRRRFKAMRRDQGIDVPTKEKAKAPDFEGIRLKKTTQKSKANAFGGVNKTDYRYMANLRKREEEKYDEELDEDIEGIWDFMEKERACVLNSQLNTLVNEKKWDRIIKRSNVYPGEASLWIVANTDGLVWKRLPLHVVCRHQPPTKVVETMVSAFPESPAYRDNLKWLPIHYACKFGASFGVIEVLIDAAPNAIHARNRDGDTPLDLIMRDFDRDEREKYSIAQLLTLAASSSDEEDENEE